MITPGGVTLMEHFSTIIQLPEEHREAHKEKAWAWVQQPQWSTKCKNRPFKVTVSPSSFIFQYLN